MQASSDQLLKLPPISRSTIIRRYEFPQHIQQMLAVKKNIKEEMSSGKPTQQTDQLMFEFIAKVNYANCIYTSTHLLPDGKHYKFFVNRYNNPILIRKTFMRRPWWKPALTDDAPDLNFAWTQLPIKALYSRIPALNSTLPTISSKVNPSSLSQSALTRYPNFIKNHRKHFRDAIIVDFLEYEKPNSLKFVDLSPPGSPSKAKKKLPLADALVELSPLTSVMQNKLECNFQYGHKSAMILNLRHYCRRAGVNLNELVPVTFYLNSLASSEFLEFKKFCEARRLRGDSEPDRNLWLVKPAENTFGGKGIRMADSFEGVETILKESFQSAEALRYPLKFVIQKYIEKPLLYKNRKFDVRTFLLITSVNKRMKAFWFPLGYLRTSAKEYSLEDTADLPSHITNDCLQKHLEDYGKHELGNKVMYEQFEAYLTTKGFKGVWAKTVVPKMKRISLHLVKAICRKADPHRRAQSFELVGLDFLVDEDFNPLLIEANNSPSLVKSENELLNSLLALVVEQVFQLAVDPVFPPPPGAQTQHLFADPLVGNKFELLFDEERDLDLDLGPPHTYGYVTYKTHSKIAASLAALRSSSIL